MENVDIFEDDLLGDQLPGVRRNRSKKAELGPVAPTLLANMERVVQLAEDSQLSEDFYKKAADQLQFIAQKMHISTGEALLLSLFMEMSNMESVSLSRVGRYVRCGNLRMLSLKKDIENLHNKGFIRVNKRNTPFDDECDGFTVAKGMQEAVMANKMFKPEPISGLSTEELFDRIGDLFEEGGMNALQMVKGVDNLIKKNAKLPFCQKVEKNLRPQLSERDLFLFYFFCNELVNECDEQVSERDWRCYFDRRIELRNLREEMQSNQNALQCLGLVESNPDNGMFGPSFRLSTAAKMEYLEGLNIIQSQSNHSKDLLKWDDFAAKQLFYNEKEAKQIGEITRLLQEDQFKAVQQRLEESGMRKGFACLFYGAPGTGKTETVNQLARQTGRDVMVIDVSQIKDKFVGESEKNIKEAFDRYRSHVKRSVKAPILLFNEADAVLGIRQEGASRAVDKMENSIQNIILQEMENLDGIMIATTNLTQNLDSAFERRFIYKVEFHKPTVAAKKSIWKSMVPSMEDALAQKLAEKYDFSGGQIENIARKRAVSYVLTGNEPTDEAYMAYCDEEMIQQKQQHKKVGFC